MKKIGDRIRELRKGQNLSQERFARQVGVNRGYISNLETHQNEPSEQLILSVCRTFGVTYDWLKYGTENKYGKAQQILSGGDLLAEEIIKELFSPTRRLPISSIAQVLDIDPDTPSNRLNLPKSFFYAVMYLTKIFREGDPDKIEAILAQLKAFIPPFDWATDLAKIKRDLKK